MKPVRILQVATIMNRGGAETLLMNIYRKIDHSKLQFDFLTHRLEKGHYDDEIKALGGKVYHLPAIRPHRYIKYFSELDNFFSEHPEYRIVHSHINENSGFVLRAAKKANIPVRIAHSHLGTLPIDFKLPFRYYGRYYLRDNCTHYFACSTDAGNWLFNSSVKKGYKVTVLNNGVDSDEFKFEIGIRNSIRKSLGIEDAFVIGHVGRFEEQKNHTFIIDIFNEVLSKKDNAVLLLIGTGKLKSNIEDKVKAMGIDKQVKFLGVRSDIPKLMQAMDVFLFPSLFEGLPVALVEAEAAGLKCIVSDTITKEADIGSNNIEFISLKQNKAYWAEKIISSDIGHKDAKEAIIKSGFDSKQVSKSMEKFYLSLHKESISTVKQHVSFKQINLNEG